MIDGVLSAIADLEDLSQQSHGRDCIDRFICGSDDCVSAAVRISGSGPRAATVAVWFAVTRNPTAAWLGRQITEAVPWGGAPKYVIRDHDRRFRAVVKAHGPA